MGLNREAKNSRVYFVENLTLLTWFGWIWPRLLWSWVRGKSEPARCFIIDGSLWAMFVARVLGKVTGATVEYLQFRQLDVLDEAGRLVRLRIGYKDLAEVQEHASKEPGFKALTEADSLPGPLPMFLRKSIIGGSLAEPGSMRRALMLVQVCHWKMKQNGDQGKITFLVLERRPWLSAISRYALTSGVQIIPALPPISFRTALRRQLSPHIWDKLRTLRYQYFNWPIATRQVSPASESYTDDGSQLETNIQQVLSSEVEPGPRIAVEYYGQFNLDRPELYSDLFFWHMAPLSGKDLLLTFSIPRDPLDEQKLAELTAHGIRPIVLHPGATTISKLPVFRHSSQPDSEQQKALWVPARHQESRWLNRNITDYLAMRAYWNEMFSRNNVKLYVTWYKYDGTHCAIADALQELGGVTAIYQRSYETHPLADGTTYADIVFGFSAGSAEVDRRSNSIIRYHVTTGYLGDHRFALLRDNARTMRNSLLQNGAKHILAFFDENSGDDPRWHTGHEFMQQNYAFLLEKVLNEPGLGLVIKPKSPGTLRKRLGHVAAMLEQAEATGRCRIFEEGALHGSHVPAEAALAADIAIHGHICAATAGVEAALAGVPTLLLDREGWPDSPLYRLGVGKVVFTDWENLWEACQQQWSNPRGIEGLGDWASILDELDPFRDGRSAERMGTYLQWLLDGFKAGLDRELVMANAAERYCDQWGADKITEVNTARQQEHVPATVQTG